MAALEKQMQGQKVGDAFDEGMNFQGPQVSQVQYDRIMVRPPSLSTPEDPF